MRLLIVDDEKDIVHLIKRSLEMEGYDAICAYTGQEAIQRMKTDCPDIVLLDIMLPDMDGYEVLEQIHEIDHTKPIIFISAQDKLTNRILGLELGADDYITKPFNTKELVLKVKAIWRRMHHAQGPTSTSIGALHLGEIELHPSTRKVLVCNEMRSMTYKEFDTLYYLARNYAHVFSREQLLNEIWGVDFMGNTRAVDILIKRLRTKIKPCDAYIHTLYGVGYKFEVADNG